MGLIFDEIFRALGYLFIAAVIFGCWKIANDSARDGNYKKTLWKSTLWCVGLALFAAIIMGNATCQTQSDDPLYGNCEQYADNGYEPNITQRASRFAYIMTLLYVPAVIGSLRIRLRYSK